MAMANHGPFPVEILRQIFEHLITFDQWEGLPRHKVKPLFSVTARSRTAMRAVSLTCHIFHEVVQPLLWRHVCLGGWESVALEREGPTGPTIFRLMDLLKLWRSRPDIAAHVQTLSIGWHRYLDDGDSPPCITEKHVEFLREVAQELGLDDLKAKSLHSCGTHMPTYNDCKAIVTGLLVLLAQKAKVLELFVASDAFLKCLPVPKDTPLRLESLRHIRLHLPLPRPTAVAAPLLKMAPNVRRFDSWEEFYGWNDTAWGFIDWAGMTSISLKTCWAEEYDISNVITQCRNLQELALLPAPRDCPPSIIGAIERHHASTLRKFGIDFRSEEFSEGVESMGSLVKFGKLEELTLSIFDLGFGESCVLSTLPPNLERLELLHYPGHRRDEIARFAGQIRCGGYPKLREVQLQAWGCEEAYHRRYVNVVDADGDDPEENNAVEDCEGGKAAMELKTLLVNAGVECSLLPL